MEIDVVSTLNYSRPAVFAAMRDQMTALAAYMPNIEQITVESRDDSTPGEVRLVNRWQAARSEVPAVARKFVDPARMFWLDHARWIEAEWRCEWRLEMGFMAERISCSGVTTYHEVDGGTEVVHDTFALDQVRVSVSWKALVFTDDDEAFLGKS